MGLDFFRKIFVLVNIPNKFSSLRSRTMVETRIPVLFVTGFILDGMTKVTSC